MLMACGGYERRLDQINGHRCIRGRYPRSRSRVLTPRTPARRLQATVPDAGPQGLAEGRAAFSVHWESRRIVRCHRTISSVEACPASNDTGSLLRQGHDYNPSGTGPNGHRSDDLIHGKNSTGGRFASIPPFTSATLGVTDG